MKTGSGNVDAYIQSYAEDVQAILFQLRKTILEIAPDAREEIGYGMPAYKTYGKPLVYFAGHKEHIGFYATPSGHRAFAKELSKYKHGKGSVQFPLDKPIPFDLIERIVAFRVKENAGKNLSDKK